MFKMVGGWLVDGLSNIFGKHRHPVGEYLWNNQCNGMTEGFELRTDGFWIKGAYTEIILYNWLVRGLWTNPQLGYLWKPIVFHGMALGVWKTVSHGKVGSKEQVHYWFSPFPIKHHPKPGFSGGDLHLFGTNECMCLVLGGGTAHHLHTIWWVIYSITDQ